LTPSAFDRWPVTGTVLLAFGLWFATFYLDWGIFWFKISASALLLAGLALLLEPMRELRLSLGFKTIGIGLISAALLYAIFWAGKAVSTAILPFAGEQIGAIYGKGEGSPVWAISLLLFFITGPCEEIYWRGFLQRKLMWRFGEVGGYILATLLYAAVHIWSLNFMLIGAAAVAGAFWGAMYWRLNDIRPLIISHSIWATFIFAVIPIV